MPPLLSWSSSQSWVSKNKPHPAGIIIRKELYKEKKENCPVSIRSVLAESVPSRMCFVRDAAPGCWWLWRLILECFPRILLKWGVSVLPVRGKRASIAWELSCSGESWRPSTGFSGWGRHVPPLGAHPTGTFPKSQRQPGKSPLPISSSDRRMKNLPCFLPGWSISRGSSGCLSHQMCSTEASGGYSTLQVAFPWMLFQHGLQNPWWTPGTTDILWSEFFPTLQMFCGWKFPFQCLRYLGKFPADAAVATEPRQQCFEHLSGHFTELSLDFLSKISLFAAAAAAAAMALCVYNVLFPLVINISLNEDNPCLYT